VAAIVALLDSRAALTNLRRAFAPERRSVVSCRSVQALDRVLQARLLDVVVLGLKRVTLPWLELLRTGYPAMPIVVYGTLRPDDGELLLTLLDRYGVADAAVDGVDDAVVGELVRRRGLGALRAEALTDAPRVLRLDDPLQREAWSYLLRHAGEPVSTAQVADALHRSREHLSRQFAAGGAPNLKRVVNFLRLVCAAQLTANPAYDLHATARLLGFSHASHLQATSRRLTGLPATELSRLGPRGVLVAFRRTGTRSRL
jgi:AraC-like DNA-binding protein